VRYFVDLELSMITLGTNYQRWATAAEPGSKAEAEREARIQAEIKIYSDAIQGTPRPDGSRAVGQLTTYAPLPNVAVDLRTRRVWGTLVRCSSPSTRAPQNCPSYEGYPVTPGPGAPPVPFDCGVRCPDFTSEGWVSTTGASGGWQVPSVDVLRSLLGPMPATVKPATWLKQNADVTFAGPGDFDIWTANFGCEHSHIHEEGFDPPVKFELCDVYGRPFLEMTTGNYPTSASNACRGAPCNAWYLLSRPGIETELAKWGVGTPS
jgi:hypothetical protein